jgi:arabinofuranosyltransferase
MSKKNIKQSLPAEKEQSNKPIVFAGLVLLCIVFIVICNNNRFIQDDAFISFRYVQNFVDGHGLVFNIGERVEGYTNLLWVLILSALVRMNFDIGNTAQTLSLAFGVLVLVMTYLLSGLIRIKGDIETKYAKKSKTESVDSSTGFFDLIPSALLVFTGSFVFWAISGMETTMFISFCLLGIYYYIKDKDLPTPNYKFPIFILLATLTRPEGMYFFGLILIHRFGLLFMEKRGEGLKEFFSKKNLISYLVYVIPVIFYFVIRYSYYGYLFPNTYYAKTGLSSQYITAGIEYFMKFFSSYLLYGVILVAPVYLFRKKENFFEISLFYLLIVSFILYVISVGGDVLKQNRFFLPILPMLYILFAKFLTDLYYKFSKNLGKGIAFASVLIISTVICYYYYTSQKENLQSEIASENGLVEKMKITGNWFKNKQREAGRPLVLAATTIGAVSYFAGSDVVVIDNLGLTDKEIAHNPKPVPEISAEVLGWKERNYNADYVMSRNPDYVYFSTGIKPSAYGERALFTTKEFIQGYYPYYFSDKNSQFTEVVYKRKNDSEVNLSEIDYPGNPAYTPAFVNMFTDAMNTSRDKSRTQLALTQFQQSAEMGPAEFDMPYQYIGDLHFQQGKKDLAMDNYKKAVEIDESNVMSQYQLYQMYSEKGDTLNARNSYEKILKYDPEIFR